MEAAANHRSEKRPKSWQLPPDLLLEIMARTDPATLLRCAATCKDLRRLIAEPAFHGCLRLQCTEQFVPSLLRGHLVEKWDKDIYLVDYTTGDYATMRLSTEGRFPPGPDGEPLRLCKPIAARHGLILLRTTDQLHDLFVCSTATGECRILPPEPTFNGHHALLVGDSVGGAVGRPFQVLKVNTVLAYQHRSLRIQTFSSEQGTWGPCTDVLTPFGHGRSWLQRQDKPLVIGDTVHWMCHWDSSDYIFKLHVNEARVTLTKLPTSFRRACTSCRARQAQILLSTMTAAGSPVVLVANNDNISAWLQAKNTTRWKEQVVIENEALLRFTKVSGLMQEKLGRVRLVWFAERSGVVLVSTTNCGFFWLNLGSKEILWWSLGSRAMASGVTSPYEIDLSSWAPTLRKAF